MTDPVTFVLCFRKTLPPKSAQKRIAQNTHKYGGVAMSCVHTDLAILLTRLIADERTAFPVQLIFMEKDPSLGYLFVDRSKLKDALQNLKELITRRPTAREKRRSVYARDERRGPAHRRR